MFFKNRKVLVTGAGGFIGSHLIEALYKSNCRKIRAFIHYNSQNRWGNIEFLPDYIIISPHNLFLKLMQPAL